MRPSNMSGGSTMWSSTEIEGVPALARGSGSGRNVTRRCCPLPSARSVALATSAIAESSELIVVIPSRVDRKSHSLAYHIPDLNG